MRSYHLLDIENFDTSISEFSSKQQYSIVTDAEPVSILTKKIENYYKDFTKYELFHETKRNNTGRAYGRNDSFDKYVWQKSFNVYLWHDKNILIFEANKSAVNGCIRRFRKEYRDKQFKLTRRPVDFNKVISRATNITGGWFGDLSGNVSSIGLFGDHVDLSGEYDRYSAIGTLSALTIEVDLSGAIYKFMITKDRSIVLYNNDEIEKDLDLIAQIYKELL